MWPRRILGAVSVSCATTACSLLVSTSGLVGESRADGGGTDAGRSEASADAERDDGTTDGARVDGGVEAGGPFCSARTSRPLFCADFDSANTPDEGWTFHQSLGGNGGVFQIDRTVSVSSPASLLIGAVAGDPIPSGGITNWMAYEPPQSNYAGIHFECQLRIETLDPGQKAFLVGVGLGSYLGDFALVPRGQMYFVESGTETTLTGQTPAAGVWSHLEIDFTGIPTKATIKLDGAVLLADHLLPPPFADLTRPQGRIGVRYYENGMVIASSVHFDNVLLEAR